MKRTLEKLAHQRKQKEKEFSQKLNQLKKRNEQLYNSPQKLRLKNLLSGLEKIFELPRKKVQPKKSILPFFTKPFPKGSSQETFNQQAYYLLKELTTAFEQNLNQINHLLSSLTELFQLNLSLTEAKDKEWDALGSNHTGMIFKSMEWRVNKLAHEYEDTRMLMKKFLRLEEKLNRLLVLLEEKKIPSGAEVKEIVQSLEDCRYAGFENRFRGSEKEVKTQQQKYLSYFQTKGKVVDLGCGRGEFMELLLEQEKGLEVEGVDINQEMIDICQEKGLSCQKGDILETLAGYEDNSLTGIFSSQVIEHLPPVYLERMIQLSYSKLSPYCYLVMETINPSSLFALAQVYFLDLSHQQPVHPQTLKFLLEKTGFEELKIEYSAALDQEKLQHLPSTDELTTVFNQNMDKLNELLYAPLNYAAVGQKK